MIKKVLATVTVALFVTGKRRVVGPGRGWGDSVAKYPTVEGSEEQEGHQPWGRGRFSPSCFGH